MDWTVSRLVTWSTNRSCPRAGGSTAYRAQRASNAAPQPRRTSDEFMSAGTLEAPDLGHVRDHDRRRAGHGAVDDDGLVGAVDEPDAAGGAAGPGHEDVRIDVVLRRRRGDLGRQPEVPVDG